MVVLAIGVTPDTKLAKEAGLELGIKGSILVNDNICRPLYLIFMRLGMQ